HDVSPGFSLGVGTCSCGHEAGQTHRERKYGRPPAGQAAAIPALAQRYSLLPPHTQHLALSAKSVVGYLYARVAALEIANAARQRLNIFVLAPGTASSRFPPLSRRVWVQAFFQKSRATAMYVSIPGIVHSDV